MWSLDNLNGNFAADSVEIREVWDSNLEEEISLIRSIIFDFPFVSMDTESPGPEHSLFDPSASPPIDPLPTSQRSSLELNYHTLQLTVNTLKLIQLGLTFFDSSGHLPHFGSPPRPCIWQFNFREFNRKMDMCQRSSMARLRLRDIDLEKNHRLGVTTGRFSELFSFGILQNDSLQWITFNSYCDLGYLLKALTCRDIPRTLEDFHCTLRLYFPKFYDMKVLMKHCNIHGELYKVAEDLEVRRLGACHQVGLDSLLVAAVFKKLKDQYFDGSMEKFARILYG